MLTAGSEVEEEVQRPQPRLWELWSWAGPSEMSQIKARGWAGDWAWAALGRGCDLDKVAPFSQGQIPGRHTAVSCQLLPLPAAGRMEVSRRAP